MRRGWLWLVLAVALAGCQDRHEWNQKLTIEVETLDGMKSGSAVVQEIVHHGQLPLSASGVNYEIKGEATIVEVAPGKYLFALLGGVEERAARTWPGDPADPGGTFAKIEDLRESRALAPENYPMLVTFADVNDPKSVKLVDPENLAATFGPGFALKQITLEITDEKVTEGRVEKVLRWEPSLVGSIGKNMDLPYNHILNQINDGSFSIGVKK